jgi:D-alanine-D-alanine ligase
VQACVLYAAEEACDSPFVAFDPPMDPSHWLPGYRAERCLIQKGKALEQIRALARQGFEAFINLCDGAADEARAGLDVVLALERLGLPFTGAGSTFYEPSRDAMASACRAAGLYTPPAVVAKGRGDVTRAATTLRFPLIVKHPESYGSVGMRRSSRVETPDALAREARRIIRAYGAARIEEFIDGPEFTALVAEAPEGVAAPLAFTPMEFVFPPGESFKHFELKWIDYHHAAWRPVADGGLAARIQDASRRLFTDLGGSGYGRCDLRMDAAGRLFVLEINPNCAVFYAPEEQAGADMILASDPLGHRGFLDHLLRCAERRANTVPRR